MTRFALSDTNDWQLRHRSQDLRGWEVHDARDNDLGTIRKMIADTDSKMIETLVLDSGRKIPARDVSIGQGVVRLKEEVRDGHRAERPVEAERRTPAAAGGYEAHRDAFREHYDETYGHTERDWDDYEPAYRYGHACASDPEHRGRDYDALEPTLRSDYEREHGEGSYAPVRDAVRHGFTHSWRHDH